MKQQPKKKEIENRASLELDTSSFSKSSFLYFHMHKAMIMPPFFEVNSLFKGCSKSNVMTDKA